MRTLAAFLGMVLAVSLSAGDRNAHIPEVHRNQYIGEPKKGEEGEWVYTGTYGYPVVAKGTWRFSLPGKGQEDPKVTRIMVVHTYVWVPKEESND